MLKVLDKDLRKDLSFLLRLMIISKIQRCFKYQGHHYKMILNSDKNIYCLVSAYQCQLARHTLPNLSHVVFTKSCGVNISAPF